MKKSFFILLLFFLAPFSLPAGEESSEKGVQKEREIVIPLKTGYAPQEREVILGFDIADSEAATTWVTSLEFEYSFWDRIEFDLEMAAVGRFPEGESSQFGLGDTETGVKVKILESEEKVFNLAGGVEATWPTGEVDKEIGEGKTEVGPFLAASKMWGPVSVLASFGYERTVGTRGTEAAGSKKNSFALDGALGYTFDFGLSPLLEVNASFENENTVALTPGAVYAVNDRFQVRGGVQVPVTEEKEFDWNAVFQLLYDFGKR